MSFEDRCVTCLEFLQSRNQVARGFLLEYGTVVRPVKSARDKRAQHENHIVDLFNKGRVQWERHSLFPYRMAEMFHYLSEVEDKCKSEGLSRLVIDMTCMTKIHTVALSEWLVEREPPRDIQISLAATPPRQYGWQQAYLGRTNEYREVIFAPVGPALADVTQKDWQPVVDVIALAGHEGARLRLAMSVLEVAMGLGVIADSTSASDASVISRLENADFLSDARANRNGVWDLLEVGRTRVEDIDRVVCDFMKRGKSDRLVIVPLGPKPLIVQSFVSALTSRVRSVWVSYPVPQGYSVGYSIGSDECTFFDVSA